MALMASQQNLCIGKEEGLLEEGCLGQRFEHRTFPNVDSRVSSSSEFSHGCYSIMVGGDLVGCSA